ncbi:hypothetical protein MBLNU457_3803t1 [Dothideomycetes sp. NU457]
MADTDAIPVARVDWPAPPLHRKYVRAIYEYHPAQFQDVETVSLRLGDLVLVHLTHGNGWLDGTVLGSGTRGWLPANYCQPYDHEHIRHLLHALTRLWTECASNESSSHQDRDHAGLIAGVRYLLEHNHCLRSDDALVKNNLTVRRTRSNLLADLSVFVKTQDAVPQKPSVDLSVKEALEQKGDYMYKAFRVAVRAVRLLDVCIASAENISPSETQAATTEANKRNQNSALDVQNSHDRSQALSSERSPQVPLPAAGIAELPADPPFPHVREGITRDSAGRRHVTATIFSDESPAPSASPRGLIPIPEQRNESMSASDLLSMKHQAFLDAMGSFIALHMQSRPSSDLWQVAIQSSAACAALLDVLYTVRDEIGIKSSEFTGALVALKDRSIALSTAIPGEQRPARLIENSAAVKPAKGRMLINAATACVRCAGDCVSQARQFLDTHGNFMVAMGTDQKVDLSYSALQLSETDRVEIVGVPSSPDLFPQPGLDASPIALSTPSSYTHNESIVERSRLKRGRTADSVLLSESAVSTGYQDSVPNTAASYKSESSTRASTPDLCEPVSDFDQLSTALKLCRTESHTATEPVSRPVDQNAPVQTSESHVLRDKDNQVIAGTLPGLIEAMTSQTAMPDSILVKVFLTTYRCFTTAVDVATTLFRRYDEAGSAGIVSTPAGLRVLKFLKQWLELYWDQHLDYAALGIIQQFAENPELRIVPASREKLLEVIERARNGSNLDSQPVQSPVGDPQTPPLQAPPSIFDSGHQTLLLRQWISKCTVVDFDALEIARQLTLLDCRLFCAIHPTELLASIASRKEAKAPRVSAITLMSTNLTNLVTLSILSTQDLRKRTSIIKQWTLIANGCLGLQNYDTLMAIMSSLQSSTVVRLKQTWNLVSPRTISLLDYLKDVVNLSRNYASLRQRLTKAKTPCLPFVGLYLTDLTFLDAGNQNHRPIPIDGTDEQVKAINFDKWYRAFKILDDFQRFQTPYLLQDVPKMQAWLTVCLERTWRSDTSLNTLYKQSLLIEPSVSASNSRNGASLLDGFDFVGRIKPPRLLRHGSQLDVFRSKFMQ